MTAKVKIVADSTCDLNQELLERYQIETIALPVNLGDKACLDGVDVHTPDLFEYYKQTGKLPTTSAPTPAYYEDFYKRWTEEGYEVVHLSISGEMTVTPNIARMAAEKFPQVFPVDSRNVSCGMGMLAIYAAELRDKGLSGAEIAEGVRAQAGKVRTAFVISTLLYMYKGGRCTGVQMLGANLLSFIDVFSEGIDFSLVPAYLLGMLAAMLSGIAAIWLMKFIARKSKFGAFSYYCLGAGVLTIILSLVF